MFKKLSSIFSSVNSCKNEQLVVLPIPGSEVLKIQLKGVLNAEKVESIKQAFEHGSNNIPMTPFMTKRCFIRWFERVIELRDESIDFSQITFLLINDNARTFDPNDIDNAVERLKLQAQQVSTGVNDELFDHLGQIHRQLNKIKRDQLSYNDKQQLNRFMIAVKRTLTVGDAKRWKVQINQICKNSWSSL